MTIESKKKQHFEVTITLNEAEIQSIVDAFDQLQFLYNRYYDMPGLRGGLYKQFKEILKD